MEQQNRIKVLKFQYLALTCAPMQVREQLILGF